MASRLVHEPPASYYLDAVTTAGGFPARMRSDGGTEIWYDCCHSIIGYRQHLQSPMSRVGRIAIHRWAELRTLSGVWRTL